MHPALRIILLLIWPGIVCAQAPVAAPPPSTQSTAPARSVAVLVDVSGSLKKKFAFTQEARDIILDLVSGRGFQGGNGWVCENFEFPEKSKDGWSIDPLLNELYAPYWSGRGAGNPPLIKGGKVARLLPFGTLDTTLRNLQKPPWPISDAKDFEDRMKIEYPNRISLFDDNKTCYYLAVAVTADSLLPSYQEGCYLFVVSDEEDDPDSVDVAQKLENLGMTGDVRYIKYMAARFQKLKTEQRFHFIARFRKGDIQSSSTGAGQYVRLSWYAIGEKPQAIPPPPAPKPPEKPGDPPPAPPDPPPASPKFARSMTLLGGLTARTGKRALEEMKPGNDSDIKTFDHDRPFITWQVDGAPTGIIDSPFQVTIHRVADGGRLEQVQQIKPSQPLLTPEGRLRGIITGTSTEPLTDGIYRVLIEEKLPNNSEGLATSTWIQIKKPWNWVPWLLGASVLGAAGVIGYSVWTLRR